MENKPKFRPNPSLKLMDQVREGRCCVITIMRTAPSNLTASGYCVISASTVEIHPKELGSQQVTANADIFKRISCHTLRHSFATHMLEKGVNIRVLQTLMGHADVKTTEIYTHVMKRDIDSLQSPLDGLPD